MRRDVGAKPLVARIGPSFTIYTLFRTHLQHVKAAGFDVICICDEDEWAEKLRALGFRIVPLGMGRRPSPLAVLVWAFRLYRVLRMERPDVVHTSNAFHGLGARVAGRLARTPLVAHSVHNWFYLQPGVKRARLFRTLERVGGWCGHVVFFVGADDLEYAHATKLLPKSKCEFIGDGVDIEGFRAAFAAADRTDVRRSLGLEEDAVVVTMVARAEAPKDHALFLEAFEPAARREPRLRALLVGGGFGLDELAGRVSRSCASRSIRVLGNRTDVPSLLRASDVLVLTSTYEAFGRSLVEGMLAGLPVVGTDVPGIRRVIVDDHNGVLVSPDEPGELAATLTRLVDDRELANRLCSAAVVDAVERFDERDVSHRVCVAYERWLGRARRRSMRADESKTARATA